MIRRARRIRGGTERFNYEAKPIYEFFAGLGGIITVLAPVGLLAWQLLPFDNAGDANATNVVVEGETPSTPMAPSTDLYPSSSVQSRGFSAADQGKPCVPPGRLITDIALSPDGVLAVGTEGGGTGESALTLASADCSRPTAIGLFGDATALSFNPSGSLIYVATSEADAGERVGYISAYDPSSLQQTVYRSPPVDGNINSLEFSSDGETLYSTGDGVRRWSPDLAPFTEPSTSVVGIDDPHIADISLTKLSNGEDALFAVGTLGSVYQIDLDSWTGNSIDVCGPNAYAIAATRKHVFVVGTSCIRALDHNGRAAEVFNFSEVAFPEGFVPRSIDAVDAAHETVVVGGSGDPGSGEMYLWDPSTGAGAPINPGSRNAVRTVALSPDGRVVAADTDDAVKVWSIENT
jgi:WD40 repeat protein